MEVPARGLAPGMTPEEAARRELLEEVGDQFYTSKGISNEVAYVYLATGAELGKPQPEPTELMEMRLVPVEETLRMAREGEISGGPSALALLGCEAHLQGFRRLSPGRVIPSFSRPVWPLRPPPARWPG